MRLLSVRRLVSLLFSRPRRRVPALTPPAAGCTRPTSAAPRWPPSSRSASRASCDGNSRRRRAPQPAPHSSVTSISEANSLFLFTFQGRRELASHFPVTVLMAADDAAAARSECGFIDFVVRPTYAVLAQLSPSVGGACQTWIEVNRTYWGNLAGDRRSMEAAQRGGAAAQP